MMCTLRMQPVSSTRNFTWTSVASVSKFVFKLAQEFARNRNQWNLYFTPSFFKSCSILLTHALPDAYILRLESSHNSYGHVLCVYIHRHNAFLIRPADKYHSESDIANTSNVHNDGIESVINHNGPARINFNADVFKLRPLIIIYGRW